MQLTRAPLHTALSARHNRPVKTGLLANGLTTLFNAAIGPVDLCGRVPATLQGGAVLRSVDLGVGIGTASSSGSAGIYFGSDEYPVQPAEVGTILVIGRAYLRSGSVNSIVGCAHSSVTTNTSRILQSTSADNRFAVSGSTYNTYSTRPSGFLFTSSGVSGSYTMRRAIMSVGGLIAAGTSGYTTTYGHREIQCGVATGFEAGVVIAVWNGVLHDDGTITRILRNPGLLFEPPRVWIPVSAGGTTVDLIIADATHSHTADSFALSVDTSLSVADALHAHAADNVVLSLAGSEDLVVADAAHAHTADSTALTIDAFLAVADALHAHTADTPVLTIDVTLVVADALHNHAVDFLTLTSQSILTIQDALHAHSADSLFLETTGQVTLLIADAIHGHFVDSINLSSNHVLAISNAIHTHTADNINLSTELSLLIANALHSHYVDNLTLSNEPVLAINSALHAHYVNALILNIDTWLIIQNAMHAHNSDNVVLTFGGVGTSALVTGAILVDRNFVTSIVNAQIVGKLFDRLDS